MVVCTSAWCIYCIRCLMKTFAYCCWQFGLSVPFDRADCCGLVCRFCNQQSSYLYLHLQATLGLALDILLSEENGWFVLQQGVGRLINAIVAVLGPELSPGSIFFSRCKVLLSFFQIIWTIFFLLYVSSTTKRYMFMKILYLEKNLVRFPSEKIKWWERN